MQQLSVKDAIVRLSLRGVGARAMQVKLVSGFVTEGNTLFDFRRFWGQSSAPHWPRTASTSKSFCRCQSR